MSAVLPDTPSSRLRSIFESLPPELRRAARWVSGHGSQVALWSMRRQAQEVGVAPATMLRLARSAGYESYASFRAAFQSDLTGERASLRDRAAQLQARHGAADGNGGRDTLRELQTRAIDSAYRINACDAMRAAADALLAARQVAFLGVRSSFGIAFQMRYAYQLLRRNGLLLDGMGGIASEQADSLEAGDVLVAIAQAPYSAPTVDIARACARRGVQVVALTDDPLSPLAACAAHALLFAAPDVPSGQGEPRGPGSFFHTTAGLLGLAEQLIALLAARGGEPVLSRLSDTERRLRSERAYWTPPAARRPVPAD